MTRSLFFGVLRLATAVLGIVALTSRFVYGLGFSSFASQNFFGYLTVQSNMVAVVVCVMSGVVALRGRGEPVWMPGLRVSITTFLVVAGIVFSMLVIQSAERGYYLEVPWSDQILHYWLPVILLVDWLVGPGNQRAPWRTLAYVIGYPLVWGLATLVRGPIVGWYPYFFMDPDQVSGWLEFLAYAVGALTLFAVVASLLMLAPRFIARLDRLVTLIGGRVRARRSSDR